MIDATLNWYALRVRTGCEIAVWEELSHGHGMAGFVPRHWRTARITSGRKGKTARLEPLISGYAFVGVEDTGDLCHASRHDAVLGILRAAGEPARLCPTSLKQLETMKPLAPADRLNRGDLVTVIDGPLAGRRVRLRDFVAGKAQVTTNLFGSERTIHVPVENLEAA